MAEGTVVVPVLIPYEASTPKDSNTQLALCRQKSVALGTPMIAVTTNYRLNLFGFAASSEIIDAQPNGQLKGCNCGLRDQRVALRWVHRNIAAFGGEAS
ncbi:alpha/beta-hydrolase [Penicillium canescens]|nr:alpha/beta-hydrolase [Penicillium canescens]